MSPVYQQVSDLNYQSQAAYLDWVQKMMTLCAGALTLLVTLRDKYVPPVPHWLWLLAVCWVGLAVSLALCATIIHGHHVALLDMGKGLLDKARARDMSAVVTKSRPVYARAGDALPWTLAGSLMALVVFGLANLW